MCLTTTAASRSHKTRTFSVCTQGKREIRRKMRKIDQFVCILFSFPHFSIQSSASCTLFSQFSRTFPRYFVVSIPNVCMHHAPHLCIKKAVSPQRFVLWGRPLSIPTTLLSIFLRFVASHQCTASTLCIQVFIKTQGMVC